MKKTLLLLLCLLGSYYMEAQKTQPPVIDREKFFGDPEIRGGQLSPDGQWMSFIKNYNGIPNIWVKRINDAFEKGKPLTNDKRPIGGYSWSDDGKYILYSQDKGGNENYNIYAVDPTAPAEKGTGVPVNRNLTPKDNVVAYIMHVSKHDPDLLYVGLNDRDASWHDLYSLKISTGELKLISENKDRIGGWVFDWNDRMRMAVRSNADGSNDIMTIGTDGSYKTIYTTQLFESASPYYFTPDNKSVYLVSNKGESRDLSELLLMDPETGETKFVEKDPKNIADFGGLNVSEKTHEPIASYYEDEKLRINWKDKTYEAHYKYLQSKFPGKEINFAGSNKNEDLFLIVVSSDTDPGSVYLYDMKTKQYSFQYRPRKELKEEDMAKMEPVSYPSSDGLNIPAYLTLPKGMEAKNLPLVVNPHGGPWARDNWGFNPYAQLLANRGYAVLQMNFRGSTGYGKKFINAGNKQWGRLMQDDITWGVKYLVSKGIADPKRVAIFGGSYGGYATLAGVTITPDVYACGVDLVGPSNLITLLKSIPPYWESGRKEFTERMGNYDTPEGEAFLKSISPLFLVNNIKVPLMVVQGANDPRVKKAESDQIIVAMREKNLPVTYLLAMDEGHGFHNATNNMAFVAAMEKFLHTYIGGRYQADMKLELAERLKTLTQDIAAVKLPETNTATAKPLQVKGALTERTLLYAMNIEAGGQKMNFDYNVSVKKDNNNWNITEQATTPMGEMKISSAIAAADYTLLSKNIEQGPAKVNYTVASDKISGNMDAMGNKMPIDVKTDGKKIWAGDEGVAQCISLLPLDKGYSTTYAAFDFQTMQLKNYRINVEGMENITVPKGAFNCYKVNISDADGGNESSIVWVDKSSNTVCKMTAKNAQATYSFELKK